VWETKPHCGVLKAPERNDCARCLKAKDHSARGERARTWRDTTFTNEKYTKKRKKVTCGLVAKRFVLGKMIYKIRD